jgi:hypothetical protein
VRIRVIVVSSFFSKANVSEIVHKPETPNASCETAWRRRPARATQFAGQRTAAAMRGQAMRRKKICFQVRMDLATSIGVEGTAAFLAYQNPNDSN